MCVLIVPESMVEQDPAARDFDTYWSTREKDVDGVRDEAADSAHLFRQLEVAREA